MPSSGMLRRVAIVRTDIVFILSVRRLLDTVNLVPSPPIIVTLMMEALSSSESSILTKSHSVASQKTAFFIVTAVKISKTSKNPGQPRILLQLKPVGVLTINLFLT
jgi:hypothetical protein